MMNLKKGALTLAIMSTLTACGGSSSTDNAVDMIFAKDSAHVYVLGNTDADDGDPTSTNVVTITKYAYDITTGSITGLDTSFGTREFDRNIRGRGI